MRLRAAAFCWITAMQVHLQLVFYDADEDFPAQASILVDQHITDYLHYETIGCLISDLLDRIRAN
jgi:hypothetical protein